MSKKIFFVFLTGLIVGSGLNYIINRSNHEQTSLAVAKPAIKETPDMVVAVRLAVEKKESVKELENELHKKYNFKIYNNSLRMDAKYGSFLREMLANDDIVKQLADYKITYWASDRFLANDLGIEIDSRLSPREILEYIQTH